MEEGRCTEKPKGHHTNSDPAAKEKDIAEKAIDRRRRIQKQGETGGDGSYEERPRKGEREREREPLAESGYEWTNK